MGDPPTYPSGSLEGFIEEHMARWRKGEKILAKSLKEGRDIDGCPMIEANKKKKKGKEKKRKKESQKGETPL